MNAMQIVFVIGTVVAGIVATIAVMSFFAFVAGVNNDTLEHLDE